MNRPTALHLSAELLRDAQQGRRVRRALRAHLLGLKISRADKDALRIGTEMLNKALRVARSPAQGEQLASLMQNAPYFRQVREAWENAEAIDTTELMKLRNCLRAVLKGQRTDRRVMKQAIGLFTRITARALDALNEIETPEFRSVEEKLSSSFSDEIA